MPGTHRSASPHAAAARSSVFVAGGRETGALFRSIDWAGSPLGAIETWPASLRNTLSLLFASRHPMFLWWGPQLIQFYNDAYLPSFGVGKHPAAMGQPGRDCWPEIWPIIGPQIEGVLERGEATWHRDQLVPIFRNGSIEDVYWTYGYSPVFDDAGQVAGVLVVCTETTQAVVSRRQLVEAHAATEAARGELHGFLTEAPIGIGILAGPDHVYSFVNPTFMNLLFEGRPASHLVGKSVRQALPELEGQGFHELLDGVYRTGQPFVGAKLHISLVQADGLPKEMFINFTYQARRDATGRIVGILAVVYEVTDQVNAQREIELLAENLRAALVARDTFMGVASHELKTPLTSLKLQTQTGQLLLERKGLAAFPREKLDKLLANTLRQADRLDRLVNDMLDVSRIASGKLTLEREETDLSELVHDLLDRYDAQLEAAGCVVTREIAPRVVADIDPSRIEQVLTNLVTNVFKYAPGRPVRVQVAVDGPAARVAVRDGGAGIALADQERIFDRFERASSGTAASGLGLGLYISRQIVLQHGGRIGVESAPGQGAEFSFEVPRVSLGGARG